MTDNEIIKALECCRKKECNTCPCYDDEIECGEMLIGHTLDLIKRQQEELELSRRFQIKEIHIDDECCKECQQETKQVISRTIKDFAERFKCNASILCDKVTGLPCSYTISNYDFNRLIKEMTEVIK